MLNLKTTVQINFRFYVYRNIILNSFYYTYLVLTRVLNEPTFLFFPHFNV